MGVVFRRIGGRVVPIITSALQKAKMNTPAIRSDMAKKIWAARKGKGTIGGRTAEVVGGGRQNPTSLFAQIPRSGTVKHVGVMTNGRTGIKRQNIIKVDGKTMFSNLFTKKKK